MRTLLDVQKQLPTSAEKGLTGDAVFNAPATLELDHSGRIVAIEINGCIPKTSTFTPARA